MSGQTLGRNSRSSRSVIKKLSSSSPSLSLPFISNTMVERGSTPTGKASCTRLGVGGSNGRLTEATTGKEQGQPAATMAPTVRITCG